MAGFRAINCSSFISCPGGFYLCGYTKASEHSHNLLLLFAESHRRAPCAQCTEENTPLPQGTHSLQQTDQLQSQRLAEELALGKVERVGEGCIPYPTARPRTGLAPQPGRRWRKGTSEPGGERAAPGLLTKVLGENNGAGMSRHSRKQEETGLGWAPRPGTGA